MPQVSKYPVSEEVYEKIFEIFLKTVTDFRNKRQVETFLIEFLSPTERVMLSKRLAIAYLLAKKYNYREISKVLRVSTTTVAKVSLVYKQSKLLKKIIRKSLKDEELEKMWLDFAESIARILSAGKSKSGSWRYLKEEIRKKKQKKEVF